MIGVIKKHQYTNIMFTKVSVVHVMSKQIIITRILKMTTDKTILWMVYSLILILILANSFQTTVCDFTWPDIGIVDVEG